MADSAIAEMPINELAKKKRNTNKRALKQKNTSPNESNIMVPEISESSPAVIPVLAADDPAKENHESLSQTRSSLKKPKAKANVKAKVSKGNPRSFEDEMQEMQEMLQNMRIEKEKTEELLKEKDEILKAREEELETKAKEQEKLQMELKKLQKMKEFNPTISFPVFKNKDEDNNEKKKKVKPENKRPSTPYILWCKDQWNEVKKDNPDSDFKEMSINLGSKWKTISAEDKKPYEEKYQAAKESYLQLIAKEKRENEAIKLLDEEQKHKSALELFDQYIQFKEESQKENKKTKKEKDPLKPKHPMSAFFLFSNGRRSALLAEGKTVVEAAKIAGEEWKTMKDEQKTPYEDEAKKTKEIYAKEMEAYKQKREEEVFNHKKEEEELMKLHKHEALQLLKKKEKTDNIIKKDKVKRQKKKQQNADPNKPKRPATSFLLFSKEARQSLSQERPGTNNSTVTALISLKWKELNEEEKQIWNEKAAKAMEVYKKEVEEYNKTAAVANNKDGKPLQ